MVCSMTGFGRAEVSKNGVTAGVEVRSVNSRYLDLTSRLPRQHTQRERELKDLIRGFLSRGSINITVKLERESNGKSALRVNTDAARSYYKLLNDLRKSVHLTEKVKLEHLLSFSEILEPVDEEETGEQEWDVIQEAVKSAFENLNVMRKQEGRELAADLSKRILWMSGMVDQVEKLSKERIPEERKELQNRITELVQDKFIIDQNRLELEIALIADKLDVTEECVRFRSHNKFFLEAMDKGEAVGRKLNFLVQEMNREANTIGSKTCDAAIAHLVVDVKEELEKVREQLQNIE